MKYYLLIFLFSLVFIQCNNNANDSSKKNEVSFTKSGLPPIIINSSLEYYESFEQILDSINFDSLSIKIKNDFVSGRKIWLKDRVGSKEQYIYDYAIIRLDQNGNLTDQYIVPYSKKIDNNSQIYINFFFPWTDVPFKFEVRTYMLENK